MLRVRLPPIRHRPDEVKLLEKLRAGDGMGTSVAAAASSFAFSRHGQAPASPQSMVRIARFLLIEFQDCDKFKPELKQN